MTIKVREDESARGGYAFVDLGRAVAGEQVRISLLRLDIDSRYLGLDEWQAEQAWLTPDRVEQHNGTTTVRLGPDVVDRIPDLVPVEISVEGIGVLGTVTWPSLARSGRGLSSVRIAAPRAADADPVVVTRPTPPPPPIPLPPVDRDAGKPAAPLKPPTPVPSRNRLAIPLILAMLLLLAGGGYWLFDKWSTVELRTGSDTIVFTGRSAGPFVQSTEFDLRAGDNDASWQIDEASLPGWLGATPVSGVVRGHQRDVVRLAVKTAATALALPGTSTNTISLTYGSAGKTLKREVKLVIEPTPIVRTPVLASDRSDTIVFTGPAGGPFGPSPVSLRLTARHGDVSWSVSSSYPGWLSVSPLEGRQAADETRIATLAVKPMPANLSGPGEYNGEVVFVVRNSGQTIVQKVRLVVRPPPTPQPPPPPPPPPPSGQLTGSEAQITFTGFKGGRFTPDSTSTTIRAVGEGFAWSMTATPSWVDASPRSGTLSSDGSTDITVRPNAAASSRAVGVYVEPIVFAKRDGGQRIDQSVKLVVLDPTAECDRLMTTQYDNDSPPQQAYVANVDMLPDSDIELAITACTLSMRDTYSRRATSQAGRAYASRAQRRAKIPDEAAARSDMNEALRLWGRASDAGSASAMNFLGSYYKGTFNGVMTFAQADYVQALRYWMMGANVGHTRAMRNAGVLLLWGSELYAPVERDLVRAKEFLTRAADREEWGAANELGQAYVRGDALEKNIPYGLQLLTKACLKGDQDARAWFDREYSRPRRRDGLPSPRPAGC